MDVRLSENVKRKLHDEVRVKDGYYLKVDAKLRHS